MSDDTGEQQRNFETAPCPACGFARHYVVVAGPEPPLSFTAETGVGVRCANCGRQTIIGYDGDDPHDE